MATNVLVLSEIDGLVESLRAACPSSEATFRTASVQEIPLEELREAEVIIADPVTFAARADQASGLKWLQSTYAGPDSLIKMSSARHYTVTRLAGVFGPSMAEYVMLHVLALERKYLDNAAKQVRKEWGMAGSVAQKSYRLLSSLKIGVLGIGDIGMEVAKRAAAFGMEVIACKRDPTTPMPEYISRTYGTAQLQEFLESVDYLVNLLPSTPETRGILAGGILLKCRGAVLINVGRGDVTDEQSILSALNGGHLSHAVLDVFLEEPLPSSSPLWDHPKITITPHNSAESFPVDVARTFAMNLKLWREQQPLQHVFGWERGY